MDTIGQADFADAVAALDPAAFRAFVADVYRHRPGHVAVDAAGRPVDATDDGAADDDGAGPETDDRRVYASHPDATAPGDLATVADVVVTAGDPPADAAAAVEWVGPAGLFALVRYGLPADVGDAVCERHLGAVPREKGTAAVDAAAAGAVAATGMGDDTVESTDHEGDSRTDEGETGQTDHRAAGPTGEATGARTDPGVTPGADTDGEPTAAVDAGDPPAVHDDPDDGTGRRRVWLLAVGALAVALVAASAFGAPALFGAGDDDPAVGGAATGTPTETGTPFPPTATATATATPAPPPDGVAERYAALRPTCERPPQVVVAIQLGALRTDNGTDRGIRTTYEFASPGNRQWTRTFENFVRIVRSDDYDELLTHERADYAPIEVANRTATQRVTVVDADGDAATYRFELTKVAAGEYAGCWMTDGVGRVDEPVVGNATVTVTPTAETA